MNPHAFDFSSEGPVDIVSEDDFIGFRMSAVKGMEISRVAWVRFPLGFYRARWPASSQYYEVYLPLLFISPISQPIFPTMSAKLVEHEMLP